jgi:methylmalonyl-CoA mutase
MAKELFNEFEPVSSKQWKQQIQFELKGADYNETLVWESPEGIKVKPFYHSDENEVKLPSPVSNGFKIVQNIYVYDVKKSNEKAIDSLQRGAECIRFTLENETVSLDELMVNPLKINLKLSFYKMRLVNWPKTEIGLLR